MSIQVVGADILRKNVGEVPRETTRLATGSHPPGLLHQGGAIRGGALAKATEPPSESFHLTGDDRARIAIACGFIAGGPGILAGGAIAALCGAAAVPKEHKVLGMAVAGGAGLLMGLVGARLPLPGVALLTGIVIATALDWSKV
ncbi:MAG: hypothetical protein HYU64_15260 [Armatimonadetes bacterium]|nr:hypothetical protein [Armatimonadota bacterium]